MMSGLDSRITTKGFPDTFFRVSSPLSWLGALILFFLPWMDIRCSGQDGRPVEHHTFSGAQLAWGGMSSPDSPKPEWTLGDASVITLSWEHILACFLLTAYVVGLLFGLSFIAVPPTIRRAAFGMFFTAALVGLLLCASVLKLGNPLRPGPPERVRGQIVEVIYSPWYYGSYVANGVALFSFVLEFAILRRRQRRQNALIPSVNIH